MKGGIRLCCLPVLISIGRDGNLEKDFALSVRARGPRSSYEGWKLVVEGDTAVAALAPCLPPKQTTVGGFIAVRHNAPTPVGQTIKATATVTAVRGKKISFTITASDENGAIGEAEHTRFLVDEEAFMKKLQK